MISLMLHIAVASPNGAFWPLVLTPVVPYTATTTTTTTNNNNNNKVRRETLELLGLVDSYRKDGAASLLGTGLMGT